MRRHQFIRRLPVRVARGEMLAEYGGVCQIAALPLLKLLVESNVHARSADILAAENDAAKQRFASGHPVVVIGAGALLDRAAKLDIRGRETQAVVFALVEILDAALSPLDADYPHIFQKPIVYRQLRFLRLLTEKSFQLRAEISAQLLPYQGILLFLRRERDQEQQHYAAEPQNQHHNQIMQHERQHTAGNDAEHTQKYADTLRGLIPPQLLRQLRVGHSIIHLLSPQ